MDLSPYKDRDMSEWELITDKLVREFPLNQDLLVSITELAWKDIFSLRIGESDLIIGQNIYLPAQAIGVILENLIAFHLSKLDNRWKGGEAKNDKDIVCSFDNCYSFEIKTSSSKNGIYGNRSTGFLSQNRTKNRTGYYLIINYKIPKKNDTTSKLWKIRFGWIDDEDWVGQTSESGQQASISADLAKLKLVTLMESL
jgi:hypothetical protein